MSSELTLQSFALGDRIGRGRFGHVYRVQKKDTGVIYAMKMLIKEELQRNGVLDQLQNEVQFQAQMKHKYILRLLAVIQDTKRVYLFTDYAANGNLYSALKSLGKFPEPLAGKYLRQLLNALCYLHTKKIIHRDIKPENLLIGSTGDLILADFGWSVSSENGRSTVCGTPDYLPPEMIEHRSYSDSVDSWTCGVLCYEFIVGKAPFTGSNNEETYERITTGVYNCPTDMSAGVKAFISVSLRLDPVKRYSCGELYLHKWTQDQDESAPSVLEYKLDTVMSGPGCENTQKQVSKENTAPNAESTNTISARERLLQRIQGRKLEQHEKKEEAEVAPSTMEDNSTSKSSPASVLTSYPQLI